VVSNCAKMRVESAGEVSRELNMKGESKCQLQKRSHPERKTLIRVFGHKLRTVIFPDSSSGMER
jgi:hypothetical protein